MTINYVSNLPLNETSGGGSGVNFSVFKEFSKREKVNYIGPINSPVGKFAHYISKLRRIAGFKGKYFFFSEDRLNRLANSVHNKVMEDGDCLFFHGITPWIKYKPGKPYFAYTDACFHTYINIFNKQDEFLESDKNRIFEQESAWMDNANIIFFRSNWALEATKKAYKLNGKNFRVAGLGGYMEIPETIQTNKKKQLLFISKEFVPKGGLTCFSAFTIINQKYPEFNLVIIGDKPPDNVLAHKNVKYLGFLNKNIPEELVEFRHEIAQSFLLIHPTVKDTNALVLTEAGYFGCPSISVRNFAIPEFIKDGETGFLIENADDYMAIAEKVEILITNERLYQSMVNESRNFTTNKFRWDLVCEYMVNQISDSLS